MDSAAEYDNSCSRCIFSLGEYRALLKRRGPHLIHVGSTFKPMKVNLMQHAAATSSTELAPAEDPFQLILLYDFAQRKVHWLWLSLATTISIYYLLLLHSKSLQSLKHGGFSLSGKTQLGSPRWLPLCVFIMLYHQNDCSSYNYNVK